MGQRFELVKRFSAKLRAMKLPVGWDLPGPLSRRLGDTLGRQRALVEEGQLLLILHEPPRAGEKARHSVAYWRTEAGEWKSSSGGGSLGAVRGHFGAYDAALDALETRLDKALDARACFEVLGESSPLHRAAANGVKALQEARDGLPDAIDVISLRDAAGEVERRAELLHGDAQNALEFQIARQSEEQARFAASAAQSAHRFNLVAAVFLPITALASIFGMNLPSGLENSSGVFWLIFLVGILTGGALAAAMAGRKT